MSNTIPVLAIRQPWTSLIAEGYKTIEVRSRNTLKRGKIAIYASRTTPDHAEMINAAMGNDVPFGKIIATACLYLSSKVDDENTFDNHRSCHFCTSKYYNPNKTYFWCLKDIQKIEPIDFKFSKGHVVWDTIEESQIIPA